MFNHIDTGALKEFWNDFSKFFRTLVDWLMYVLAGSSEKPDSDKYNN